MANSHIEFAKKVILCYIRYSHVKSKSILTLTKNQKVLYDLDLLETGNSCLIESTK
jgi:hypothetical protein